MNKPHRTLAFSEREQNRLHGSPIHVDSIGNELLQAKSEKNLPMIKKELAIQFDCSYMNKTAIKNDGNEIKDCVRFFVGTKIE